MNTCWICGKEADSSEHRNKKTDIELIFGSGSYKDNRVIKREFGSDKKEVVQGPGAKALKYDPNLCKHCNGTKTQPHDDAYKKFISHIKGNYEAIKKSKIIQCSDIYGKKNRKQEQQNLFKYFMKTLGCRIDSIGHKVPQEFIDAINGQNYGQSLKVSIQLNSQYIPAAGEYGFHGLTDQSGNPVDYFWGQYAGWVNFYYAYNRDIPKELGEVWLGKSKNIHCAEQSV